MHRWIRALALVALLAPALPAAAQDYPTRPIRVIASQGPGGLSDIWMRAVADEMGPVLGGTVVVEDRTGAGGSIGARACGEAAPDGYTFCILPAEAMVINPVIYPIAGFDPKKSLVPVTKAFYLTQVFAVNASLNVKSFDELVALAKAKPKTLNYMAAALSKVAFVEEMNRKEGTDIVRVPFKGGGDAVNSMLTGTTQIAIFGIGNLIQFIRNGKIIGFAVDGDQRSPLAPTSRPSRETGYTITSWPDVLRHLRAGRHAEADHRQAQPGDRQGRVQSGIPEAAHGSPWASAGAEFVRSSSPRNWRAIGPTALRRRSRRPGLYPDVK